MREKKAAANTVLLCRAALRFLYLCTLKQTWFDASIPHPKRRATLPGILSADEITRMLDRTIKLKHWAILATFYATALRCRELQHLKVQNIDSERILIHLREANGGVPRQIPLSPVLLERLRFYVCRYRPQDWLPPRDVLEGFFRTCCLTFTRSQPKAFPSATKQNPSIPVNNGPAPLKRRYRKCSGALWIPSHRGIPRPIISAER